MSDSVFQRDKIPFRMLGQEYQYEFIPSFHLQEVMVGLTSMVNLISYDVASGSISLKEGQDPLANIGEGARKLLLERIYQIIGDVLKHQNNVEASLTDLKYKTRPLEIAKFLDLLMNDKEVEQSIATLGKSLAQMMSAMLVPLQMRNFTPSSPTTLASTGNTSTTE